jgi:hypothetical protein
LLHRAHWANAEPWREELDRFTVRLKQAVPNVIQYTFREESVVYIQLCVKGIAGSPKGLTKNDAFDLVASERGICSDGDACAARSRLR